jgi:hypothetical protein
LNDGIAPLIDMIFQILKDITNFMIVYVLAVFMIAYVFWIMSYCQIDEGVDPETIDYLYLDKAFFWAWNIGLGLSGTESFMMSSGIIRHSLMMLFLVSTFIINVLLLNLLIAIMGDTFSQQSSITEQLLIKDHLQFIIDSWYLAPLSFKEKDKQYLIVAYNSTMNDQDMS